MSRTEYKDFSYVSPESIILVAGSMLDDEIREIRIFMKDGKVIDNFTDMLAVDVDPESRAGDIAKKLASVFHITAVPVKGWAGAMAAYNDHVRKSPLGKTDVPDLVCLPVSGQENDALIVRRGGEDAGILRLTADGFVLSLLNAENTFPVSPGKDIRAWLESFLPSPDITQTLMRADAEKREKLPFRNGALTDQGLFSFISKFGTNFAGDIAFVNPSQIGEKEKSGVKPLWLKRNERFSGGIASYANPIFPAQENGFAADFHGGAFNGSRLSSQYAFVVDRYGKEKTAERVLSLMFARLSGIPTVGAAIVQARTRSREDIPVLALERFDLCAGKPLWRMNVDSETVRLSETDRAYASMRAALGDFLGFDGRKVTVIDGRADFYLMEDLSTPALNAPSFPKLAPFTGAAFTREPESPAASWLGDRKTWRLAIDCAIREFPDIDIEISAVGKKILDRIA